MGDRRTGGAETNDRCTGDGAARAGDDDGGTRRQSAAHLLAALRGQLVAAEPWRPPATSDRRLGAVRRYLDRDDAVRAAERVAVVDADPAASPAPTVPDGGAPAVVGRSRESLLAVTASGSFRVGLDRLRAVESEPGHTVSVRWRDARLVAAVAYVCSLVAFLAVMAVATASLSPALALVAGVCALGHTYFRPTGVVVGGRTLTAHLGALWPLARAPGALTAVERRLVDSGPDPVTRWTTGAATVAPLTATVALEPGLLAPLFALLTVASFGAVAAAVRHRRRFERLGVVQRAFKTVTLTVEDGSTVAFRTAPGSTLDRDLNRELRRRAEAVAAESDAVAGATDSDRSTGAAG